MQQNRAVHFLGSKDVKYLWGGRKLSEYRRAQLRPLAKAIGVDDGGVKNVLLHRIIAKLDAIGADSEIGNLGQV